MEGFTAEDHVQWLNAEGQCCGPCRSLEVFRVANCNFTAQLQMHCPTVFRTLTLEIHTASFIMAKSPAHPPVNRAMESQDITEMPWDDNLTTLPER